MSEASDFCSQNPLDDSIPFMTPTPYIITKSVIVQLSSIIDRDIETESRALRLYDVNTNKLNRIINTFPDTASMDNIMAHPNIKAAFNNKKSYSELFNTMSRSTIKKYAKQNFLNIENRFHNKASNFNIKPHYSETNAQITLHDTEKIAIQNYTRYGDGILNNFLRTGGKVQVSFKENPILEAIELCFANHLRADVVNRYEKLYFIFCKLLYNTIAKIKMAYHNTDKYIRVFRGVKSHYLSEEPNRIFYTNSFLSTSYDITVAEGFGYYERRQTDNEEQKREYHIDVFYVHPSCYYCNMKSISKYSDEKEILITPYCRYVFIKKNTFWTLKGGMRGRKYPILYTKYYYAIFPTDLIIPANIKDFLGFVKEPPSEGPPIREEASRERVVVNVVREAPVVGCSGFWCWRKGGYTRRRRSKRRMTRKQTKA